MPPQPASGLWQPDWIYVDDVLEGFLAAAHTPGLEGRTLELGSGTCVSVRTIVEELVAIMQPSVQPVFGALPDRPLEPVRVASTIESEQRLGWRPSTCLDAGLRRTVEWYSARENGINL